MKDVFGDELGDLAGTQLQILKDISSHINGIKENLEAMLTERKKANKLENSEKKAEAYCNSVKPYFSEVKYHSDKLELLIDDELWPLPKLRELLFTK